MDQKSPKNKNKSFVTGAVILGLAGLIDKLLGAFFRIPLGNIIGDDGMGYYQTAYPVYVLFLTIATAGIPTAISRMVAERYALDRPYEAHRVFKISSILLFVTGTVSCMILFFGAGIITDAIKEPGAVYSMKAIALALFFVPLMGSFRGYFQGHQNMMPTALSQVIEQIFRVGIGLTLSIVLFDKGVEYAAAGASFGATAGGFFGCIGMAVIFVVYRKTLRGELNTDDKTHYQTTGEILKEIILIAIPITIGASVMPIINVIDTAIVKNRLMAIGYDSAVARGLYGQLTGMAAPIINVPPVFTQAVSVSLVPVIASAYMRGETEFMQKNIALSVRYAMIIGMPCAAGIMALAKPIMVMFYPFQKESAVSAAECLAVLAIGTVFLSLVHATTGTLQGIGKQQIPVRNLCFGALAKVVVTYFLTAIPALNVRGAALGTVTAYFTAALLNTISVKKYTGTVFDIKLVFVKPAAASAIMGAISFGICRVLSGLLGNAAACVTAVAAGVVSYVLLVLALKVLDKEEIRTMPKGELILRLLTKMRLVK